MGSKTTIEWTRSADGTLGATWNPTTGCDRTSPGCDHCYALDMAKRLKAMGSARYQSDGDERTSGPGFGLTEHPDALDTPIRWKRPRMIFVNSMSDLFHKDVSEDFISEVWGKMSVTPRHTYQILTKRSQRMASFMQRAVERWGAGDLTVLPNVWLGTSIENDRYTFRANHLRDTPAAIRFLSLEPLLGPLPSLDLTDIDWVIVGGESGPKARPMHPAWVRDIRDRCVAADIPFHFKQWGTWMPEAQGPPVKGDAFWSRSHVDPETGDFRYSSKSWPAFKVGKHDAGRLLDGREWNEMPERPHA